MQALFDAVDITGTTTNITTLMTGFVAIAILFFGFRIVRKLLNRGA